MANAISLALVAVLSVAAITTCAAATPTDPAVIDRSSPAEKSADFQANAEKLREAEIRKLAPLVAVPNRGIPNPFTRYPWKEGIVTTIFWVGSAPDAPRGQNASAWDPDWPRSRAALERQRAIERTRHN